MKAYLLRRRRLGRTSCNEIVAKSKQGIQVVLNDRDPIPDDPDAICIRWGCTATVPQRNVFNKAEAIHLVSDKTRFRLIMNGFNLCPPTLTDFESINNNFQQGSWIVRPRTHHQGRNLYVVNTDIQLLDAIRTCGEGWYASPLINKVAEYRVFVMQGRSLAVAKKTPANPDAVAWNVAQGGRFDNVRWDKWPLKAVKYSIEAFKLSGLDFGGVDVMVDADGNCYVLEINSAPSLTSPYRQEAMAKGFDWMLEHGKDTIPMTEARGGYKKFIHPAVCDEAVLV